ncbi:methylmalonyl-CoA mutase family protein [Pseudovibrio sp. SPO723]|uniref:methylmalonyl-CoA mutase family protein n=1 Tax=Nesiotobacter zosterae TaxID=392721 RepID=UPI0029C51199|nr:methylmalonyl-CoA mutase family protein [Pseudovibrio sp. SPO723]MDX5595266.1 methylmalonyl-CoA mutase family protein [Pseudovibrio sp. SPO723]
MTAQHIDIPEEFLKSTRADWEDAATRALKGAALEKLRSVGGDGLITLPIYGGSQTAAPLHLREDALPWTLVQRVDIPDISQANAQLLEDLEGGASGIDLVFPASCRARSGGIDLRTLDDAKRLLDGVLSNLITLRLSCGHEATALSLAVIEACLDQGVDPKQLKVEGVADIIGFYARRGWLGNPPEVPEGRLVDMVSYATERGVQSALVRADGRTFHDAGANATQELAIALSCTLYYFRVLERGGVPTDRLPALINVTLSADADQFLTIIKARAMRKLWAALLAASGYDQLPLKLHMESSWRMMTKSDPWVNMLRGTVAAFAAGVGGANSVCVLPFTSALGLPNSFARRIARNTQLILAEESNLYRVMDPGAGSGMIEERTDALVAASWDYFQKLEGLGGIYNALTSGQLAEDIEKSRIEQELRLATGKAPLTGTSSFPNLHEAAIETLNVASQDLSESTNHIELPAPTIDGALSKAVVAALRGQASLADVIAARTRVGGDTCPPLEPKRLAEPFEELRAAAEAFKVKNGHLPKVFLATLGTVAQHTARATFAANLYAAGGFECTPMKDFEQIEDIAKDFASSDATIACLCSSDEIYAEQAADACALLKKFGARRITLAGRLPDLEDKLQAAGLDAFIYTGSNILEELRACVDAMNMPAASSKEAM